MKTLKGLSVLLILFFLAQEASAQFRYGYFKLGASVGATNYLGDLDDDFTPKFTMPGFAIMGSYRFHPHMTARFQLFHGWAKATDRMGTQGTGRWERNLSFRTPIREASFQITYDFFPTTRSYRYRDGIVPYIFGGIGLFNFNPQGKLNGEWIDLQPLGTEGQFLPEPDPTRTTYPDPYALTQICVPMGAGVRFSLGYNWDVEVEIGWRKIFTDYLDDVSTHYPDLEVLKAHNPTAYLMSDRSDRSLYPEGVSSTSTGWIRGDKTQDDWYIFSTVTFSYILDWVKCPRI